MLQFLSMQDRNTIYILGGGLTKGKDGVWRTIDWKTTDERFGKTADRFRIIAAHLLYEKNPDSILIASGGQGQLKEVLHDDLTVAHVMKRELTLLGVPEKAIEEESTSGTTAGQLRALIGFVVKDRLNRVCILSNRYHLPRIRTLIEHVPGLATLRKMRIELISAEEVLLQYKPAKWHQIIDEFYDDPDTKAMLESEERGVRQIKDGTYRYIT